MNETTGNAALAGRNNALVMPSRMDKTYVQYVYDTRLSDKPAIHGTMGAWVDYDEVDKDFLEDWDIFIDKEGSYLFEVNRIPDECYEGDGVGYWYFECVMFEENEA